MKTYKIILLLTSFVLSSNIFACKVSGKMTTSIMFMNGLTNKLSEIEKFNDESIISITTISIPNVFNVVIKNKESGKCLELKMEAYGTGSCDFTAKITDEKETSCK